MKTEEANTENTEQLELPFPDPEIGTLQQENEALRVEIRMRSAVYDVETQLTKAGARSPGLLAEQVKASFAFGEDGKLTNAKELIDSLRRMYPEQFGRDAFPAGSIDGGAGRQGGPMLTKESLSRMTPAEINQLDWANVRHVLAS